jgi:hypothetical protein
MEQIGAVELDRRGQEKKRPLASGCVTGPHRFYEEGFGGIALLDETQENRTNHESWNTNQGSEYQSGEEGKLFFSLH